MLTVQAGESHTHVDGQAFSKSKSATILTEDVVTVNGKQVRLG